MKAFNAGISSDVIEIFQHWENVMGYRNSKLDEPRIKTILKALKNYSIADLKKAIDGCAKSPFHMGENKEKQRHNLINNIFQDADHIEKFIESSSANGLSESEKRRRDILAGAS